MIINHNMASLNTYRQLSANNEATSKSLEKLSSGLRINRAGDDAAGLAISEKMRGQIRGLDQATRNSQDGISMIQTAEGALNETHSILQRMRELAVQSSNDTNTDADRKEIQKEITQLKKEVDRISTTTEFNTKKLLNGSIGNDAVLGANAVKVDGVKVSDSDLAADTYTLKVASAGSVTATVATNNTGLAAATDFDLSSGKVAGLKLGDYTLDVTKATATTFDLSLKNSDGVEVAKATGWDGTSAVAMAGKTPDGVTTAFNLKAPAGTVQAGSVEFNLGAHYTAASALGITNSATKSTYDSVANLTITDNKFEAGGFEFDMSVDTVLAAANSTTTITTTNNALTMHIGANQGQTMKVAVAQMDTNSLNIDDVDVTTQSGAESAITKINDAIETVSSERSKLGAFQNRLEHTINNLGTSSENLTAAESRVRDVDMAKEMMNYQKNNILSQAATAMLAQANQQPQGVLQLLR